MKTTGAQELLNQARPYPASSTYPASSRAASLTISPAGETCAKPGSLGSPMPCRPLTRRETLRDYPLGETLHPILPKSNQTGDDPSSLCPKRQTFALIHRVSHRRELLLTLKKCCHFHPLLWLGMQGSSRPVPLFAESQ